jgi:Mg2+ and Co2+ transporter CorA
MRSNEYTRRRLRNKFTNPTTNNNDGANHVADDNMKKYRDLLRQAEREQDPIEKVTLEQRAEYFRKLAKSNKSE